MVIPSYFSWIAAQLVAIGIVLSVVTDVPREYCIIASAAVVMIYTLLGDVVHFRHRFFSQPDHYSGVGRAGRFAVE